MNTILIVDDEIEIREMLKQIFPLEGYMVYTAKDGEENKVKGFRSGGDDYIEKPFSVVELIRWEVARSILVISGF